MTFNSLSGQHESRNSSSHYTGPIDIVNFVVIYAVSFEILTLKTFVMIVKTFKGHSRSPFDRSHTSSYWSCTLTVALF